MHGCKRMINQELKNKIIDYVDGILDESQRSEIEVILKSNDDANEFLNQLKSLEIELGSNFSTNEYHDFSRSLDAKIDGLLDKELHTKQQKSFLSILTNSFGITSMLGTNVATAAIFLFIGTFFLNQDDANLNQFTNEMLDKDILIFRSSSDSVSKEAQIQSILDDVYIKNIQGASGRLGSDQYELKILDTFQNQSNDHCLNVIFSVENQEATYFLYCKSGDQSSLYKEL
jgi:hypothetical protein